MQKVYYSKNQEQTSDIAKEIIKNNKNNLIYLLSGNLGAGKTTFVKSVARLFNIKKVVQSPTFVIERRYKINNKINEEFNCLVHIDLYRLNKEDQTINELVDVFNEKDKIVFIEWPDKLGKFKPKKCINIIFEYIDENSRKIIINY